MVVVSIAYFICVISFCILSCQAIIKPGYTFSLRKLLQNEINECKPYSFTTPLCFYCECDDHALIDDETCLQVECSETYESDQVMCTPGERIITCSQCFCFSNGTTNYSFCTRSCSNSSKLELLQKVWKEKAFDEASIVRNRLVERSNINYYGCESSTVYLDGERFCMCPKDGIIDNKLCVSTITGEIIKKVNIVKSTHKNNDIGIDFNTTCEPHTFVEFDCNTCFCSIIGKIDPNWCTYDDCSQKRKVLESHKVPTIEVLPVNTCKSGTISKKDCNFCICPESGVTNEIACTSNPCSGIDITSSSYEFTCEPFTYYEVDCNICYCPRDGIKNLAKCIKLLCDKKILRSNACEPGQLFTHVCNVCVCPPNGEKADKVCTNHACPESDESWRKIFMHSINQTVENEVGEDTTRSLDICFRGEEFIIGCNLCVCPEIGLRAYATCTPILCDDNTKENNSKVPATLTLTPNIRSLEWKSKCESGSCLKQNNTDITKNKGCYPGTTYIYNCQQCICPYLDNYSNFCRPLPNGTKCNDNNSKMLINKKNFTISNASHVKSSSTKYNCRTSGKVMDECFICDCGEVIVEEDCYKNVSEKCENRRPTFLKYEDIVK